MVTYCTSIGRHFGCELFRPPCVHMAAKTHGLLFIMPLIGAMRGKIATEDYGSFKFILRSIYIYYTLFFVFNLPPTSSTNCPHQPMPHHLSSTQLSITQPSIAPLSLRFLSFFFPFSFLFDIHQGLPNWCDCYCNGLRSTATH